MTIHKHGKKSGMTLVEVMIAMGLTAFMCGGLYTGGIMVHRSMERLRISTEATTYARECMEEMVAVGLEKLAVPSVSVLNQTTLSSSSGAVMSRRPYVIWHAADGTVVSTMDASGYAEVHVDIYYPAPRSQKTLVARYASIVK